MAHHRADATSVAGTSTRAGRQRQRIVVTRHCGYLAREAIATPDLAAPLATNGAVAWNPSLPGAKIEDTILVGHSGLEVLTVDPAWPMRQVRGRARPDVLVR